MKRGYLKSAQRLADCRRFHAFNLTDLIDNCLAPRGCTEVQLASETDLKTRFVYGGRDIATLIWIPQSTAGAYNIATLDSSFRATRAFVYCVAQAIIANGAVSSGFVIAPSESEFMYTAFMKKIVVFLASLEAAGNRKFPVLSDHGNGLKAFCHTQGIQRFFCHRHLIEKWGAGSSLACWDACRSRA
jgi:hypothetical protein